MIAERDSVAGAAASGAGAALGAAAGAALGAATGTAGFGGSAVGTGAAGAGGVAGTRGSAPSLWESEGEALVKVASRCRGWARPNQNPSLSPIFRVGTQQ